MITIPRSEFIQSMVPRNLIGIHGTPTDVLIFLPGDEATSEWISLREQEAFEDAVSSKYTAINAARGAAVVAPVSALGHVWDADEHSQSLLGKAILLASLGVPLPAVWRDYNGQDLPITSIDQLLAITGAMAEATQAAYMAAFARKDAPKAATTLAEIEAV